MIPKEFGANPAMMKNQSLSAVRNAVSAPVVTIQLLDDASLQWSGSLTLAPLDSEGELVLEGLHLDSMIAYLQSILPLESMAAKLSSRFRYRLHMNSPDDLVVRSMIWKSSWTIYWSTD